MRLGAPLIHVEALEARQMLAADLVSLEPASGTENVSSSANLVATFSEAVQPGAGTGNILIHDADGSVVQAINVNSSEVTFDGATVTINPATDLLGDSSLFVTIDAGAVRDTSAEVTPQTIFFEDFEGLALKNSSLDAPLDEYVVALTGILDVKVAGDYTFGSRTEDGAFFALDVDQDGLDVFGDTLYEDNSRHGEADRLNTCDTLFTEGQNEIQSCVGEGLEDAVTLAVGEYAFYFAFFNSSGSGSGELFYAPGYHEIYDAESFALVGDDSQGIGVTADGITVTTYKEEPGLAIDDLDDAFALIDDESTIIGSDKTDLANIAEQSPDGRFADDTPIPGAAQWVLDNDPSVENWTDEGPYGWERDNAFLDANRPGGQPEYNGWTFLDKDFWIAQQGDQSRTNYVDGLGTVALVDPDAFDDFVGINSDTGDNTTECAPIPVEDRMAGGACGYFTAGLSTPRIYLNGVAENSATLTFDSSWYDESSQSAEARVEFFDADGNSIADNRLLRWESINDGSEFFKPVTDEDGNDARNEHVTLALDNPANAASMVVTFSMPYAQNDWWWAIDNIAVTADVAGAPFAGIADSSWSFTTSTSPPVGGMLDITLPTDPIVLVNGQDDGDGSAGAPPAAEGVEHAIDDVTQKYLNFLDLNSGFVVTPSAGASIVSGLRLYTANDAIERDPASYKLEGGVAPDGRTVGDLDGDGSVGFPDFLVFSSNFGKSPATLDEGDLDQNGTVDFPDFLTLSSNFGKTVEEIGAVFTLISEGDLSLPDGRNAGGQIPIDSSLFFEEILFANTTAYTSYRLTFPTLKDAAAANSMQIAEVEFLGELA